MIRRTVALVLLLSAACRPPKAPAIVCRGLGPGDLAITEIMANPPGPDSGREWFEIAQPSRAAPGAALALDGLVLEASRVDGSGAFRHTVRGLAIEADSFLVLGGIQPAFMPAWMDYGYGADLSLRTSGRLALRCGEALVDEVFYTATREGVSIGFDGRLPKDAAENDRPEAWCPAQSEFEDGALGTPGTQNDRCRLPRDRCLEDGVERAVRPPRPGDLAITEVLANPSAVAERVGEWFEIQPLAAFDWNNLALGPNLERLEAPVDSEDCLPVAPGDLLVFAHTPDAAKNGGLGRVDGAFGFSLENAEGSLVVAVEGGLLDEVNWRESPDGAALAQDARFLDPGSNDDPSLWCEAGALYGQGDRGSPGAINPSCGAAPSGQCWEGDHLRPLRPPIPGDLVITEILPDPTQCGDSQGEWFEVLVRRDLDWNGLTFSPKPEPREVQGGGRCLSAAAGSLLVFAHSADPLQNGGLEAVDGLFSFGLPNGGGGLYLSHEGVLLDAATFRPAQSGVAWSLDPHANTPEGNDLPESWCLASDTFGGGDRGTPGRMNPPCP